MLPEGTAAPAFTLPGTAMDRDASEMSEYSLGDALQRGPVIVNFYLFDFHPECTEHMCSLHEYADPIERRQFLDAARDRDIRGVENPMLLCCGPG